MERYLSDKQNKINYVPSRHIPLTLQFFKFMLEIRALKNVLNIHINMIWWLSLFKHTLRTCELSYKTNTYTLTG